MCEGGVHDDRCYIQRAFRIIIRVYPTQPPYDTSRLKKCLGKDPNSVGYLGRLAATDGLSTGAGERAPAVAISGTATAPTASTDKLDGSLTSHEELVVFERKTSRRLTSLHAGETYFTPTGLQFDLCIVVHSCSSRISRRKGGRGVYEILALLGQLIK